MQVNIEGNLYMAETTYLSPIQADPTSGGIGPTFGNIIKGYDAYLKAPNTISGVLGDRKRQRLSGLGSAAGFEIRPEDRLFSTSSDTYVRVSALAVCFPLESVSEDPYEGPRVSRTRAAERWRLFR